MRMRIGLARRERIVVSLGARARGGGYGVFRDIILGNVRAFIGGIVMNAFGAHGQAGFVGSIVIAFIGAIILVGVVRALGI